MLIIVCCVLDVLKVILHTLIIMNKNTEILKKFGENIRKKRVEQGISQEELAFRASLHRTYIGMIERAEKNITLINIEKIANALQVEICELLK